MSDSQTSKDQPYTTEPWLKGTQRYPSSFDLVNDAIRLATARIRKGRVPDIYSDHQSLASEVLDDLLDASADELLTEPAPVEEEPPIVEVVIEEKVVAPKTALRKARPLKPAK